MRCPIGTIALTLLVRLVLAAPVTATTIGTGDILVSNWASDGIDRFVNGQCAALPYPNIQHGYLAQDRAFALWGAMALRWPFPCGRRFSPEQSLVAVHADLPGSRPCLPWRGRDFG